MQEVTSNALISFRGYLRDLVEAFHFFLKMLEKYCSGTTHIVVQVSLEFDLSNKQGIVCGLVAQSSKPYQIMLGVV